MSKVNKSNKKQKASKPKPDKPEKKIEPSTENEQDENPFDFGGLPARDLKKNLGCG